MPALHAGNWEGSIFERLNQRVFEGTKIKMKGYVAVQKKLLTTIYTLWKKNEAFDKQYDKNKSTLKYTEKQEQAPPSLVSLEKSVKTIKKVVPNKPELHKVNIRLKLSQYLE